MPGGMFWQPGDDVLAKSLVDPHTPEEQLEECEEPAIPRSLKGMLDRLPDPERWAMELHLQGVHQSAIGLLLNATQQAISARIKRAKYRLQILACLPDLTFDKMQVELEPYLSAYQIRLLYLYYHLGSTSVVARRVGRNQQRVYFSIRGALKEISEKCPNGQSAKALVLLFSHPRSIHFVKFKTFSKKYSSRMRHIK